MLAYWLLFLIPLAALVVPIRFSPRLAAAAWGGVVVLFALAIGLRHQVGGDWVAYVQHFQAVSRMTLAQALAFDDPGYYVLNWAVAQLGGSIYGVNVAAGFVVMAGVVVFARQQPQPWLVLLVAVPYLIVVVAMGYTRQSVAIGLALLGLAALERGRALPFVAWVIAGAFFHKTAVLLLPIAALAATRQRVWTAAWVGLTTALGAALLLLDRADALWENYVEAGMHSDGGGIRVAMNALPAALLLLFRRRLLDADDNARLWTWLAIFALVCVPLVTFASTAVDRVALYFIPLQLYVFARLPRLSEDPAQRAGLVAGIAAYYAAVLFVWLGFATHAPWWIPYRLMPM